MKALITAAALLVVLGLGFFLYSSPTASPEMTEAEIAQIEATIMDVTDAMSDAWTAYDIEATQAFFHPDKTSLAWGSSVFDYDGHRDRLEEVWGGAEGQETFWTARKIEVLSEDLVLFQGSFDLKIFFADGRVGHYPGTAHYTVLFEPYEGEWKITYGGYAYGGYQVTEGS